MYVSKLIPKSSYNKLVELIDTRSKLNHLSNEFTQMFPNERNPLDDKMAEVNKTIAFIAERFVNFSESQSVDKT